MAHQALHSLVWTTSDPHPQVVSLLFVPDLGYFTHVNPLSVQLFLQVFPSPVPSLYSWWDLNVGLQDQTEDVQLNLNLRLTINNVLV